MKKNVKFSTVFSGILLAISPSTSQAVFGIGDFNILDIPSYMAEMAKTFREMVNQRMPAILQGVEIGGQLSVEELRHKATIAMKTMPDPQACDLIETNASLRNGQAAGSSATRKFNAESKARVAKTGSVSSRSVDRLTKSQIACSDEQFNANENQCAREITGSERPKDLKNNIMAGTDKTIDSLLGATATIGDKTYTTGKIIPRNKWLGKDYKGEQIIEIVTENSAPEVPIAISNRVVNSTALGQSYTNATRKYNIRRSIVTGYLNKEAAEHLEVDTATAESVKEFWQSADTQEVLQDLYGSDLNINKSGMGTASSGNMLAPSPAALLEVAVMKEFQENSGIMRAVAASESKKEVELLVMNNYLLYKALEEQKQTNLLLKGILSHLMDPITQQNLDSLRESAQGSVVAK